MTYTITKDGETKEFEDKNEWEDTKQLLDESDVDYTAGAHEASESESDETQDGQATTPETTEPAQDANEALPAQSELTSDPLEVIRTNSDHFTDQIKGKTVINRQGYAVLAERFNISAVAEPVTLPSDTDNTYAEFRAIAETERGVQYSGFGSAHVDRDDDPTLLAELAETRAMKRCMAWATGVGMTAMSELANTLEEP